MSFIRRMRIMGYNLFIGCLSAIIGMAIDYLIEYVVTSIWPDLNRNFVSLVSRLIGTGVAILAFYYML